MFEFIRTHQRLMQFFLLLVIAPMFIIGGIQGFSQSGGGDDVVAKVAGRSITQREWDVAQGEQLERLRKMFGAQFDPKMFDTPEAKLNILNKLIAEHSLAAEAERHHLSISDLALQQEIINLSGLKTPDGKFDNDRYKSLLAEQGMTPAAYEVRLRHDLLLQKVNSAIQSTAFVPNSVAGRLSDINDQEREIQQLTFKSADFLSQVKITDDMLKAYYNKNDKQFAVPEEIKAEYVVLSIDAIAEKIAVSDADIKLYYEQNKKRFGVDEQRRASHILMNVKKDASTAEKAAAKSKAENLLAQVRKDPSSFAKIAKENSQDTGSAARGGDLDFFEKGMMVKPFEDVAYKLKQGEISDVVQSDFGFHVIQLTAIKPSSIKPMEDVKAEISAEVKKQQAAKKYSEQAEIFNNTVYEQSDSLKAVADKLKLKIETAANLTRDLNPKAATNVPFKHPKFLKALFSDDAIKNKRNTEVVEIAPNTLIAGHIVEYKAATKRPYEEVKTLVREAVTQIEAANMAKKAGEAKLAALKAKDELTGFSGAKIVSRTKNDDLSKEAVAEVMKADATKLPAFVMVDLPGQTVGVVRINKVIQSATQDKARRLTEQQQAANVLAQQEMTAYIDILKQKAKVKVMKQAEVKVASANPKE